MTREVREGMSPLILRVVEYRSRYDWGPQIDDRVADLFLYLVFGSLFHLADKGHDFS